MRLVPRMTVILVSAAVLASCTVASAATIEVPADQPTLAAAIAAAAERDTIEVAEGEYTEEVTVDKALTIKGAGPDKTVLKCGEEGTVITANADLTLEGLAIGPAKDGVMLAANRTLKLNGCLITGCKDNGLNFTADFQSRLYMTDCEVTACGDGVDLESTQGQAVNCNFHDNHDDGLDYDGDAGFLCLGCRFMDNRDDGIEVRLARRTEVVLAFCTFGGNGEDGLELINTKKLDPADNIVAVSHCKFEGNDRYDLGCVDLLTPEGERNEETSVEPPHAAMYLCSNEFPKAIEECCSPNIPPIVQAAGEMPQQMTVTWTPAGGEQQEASLTPTAPALIGIINLQPNYQGGKVGDAEGLAVDGSCFYVGDDTGKPAGKVHCFDRTTGALLKTVSTNPFAGTELSFTGPEGITVLPDGNVLVLNDMGDKGADGAVITPGPENFGDFVRHVPMPEPDHAAEGITIVGADTIYLPEKERLGLKAARLSDATVLPGWPVSYLFDGKHLHIAGVGYDGTNVLASANGYPPRGDKNGPVPENYLLSVDPTDGRPLAIGWIGAYCNDARGVACADGLVFVSDGWSPRKLESGFINKHGQKVFIFAPPTTQAAAAAGHLPVRHLMETGQGAAEG